MGKEKASLNSVRNHLVDDPDRPSDAILVEKAEDKKVHVTNLARLRNSWAKNKYKILQQELPAQVITLTPKRAFICLLTFGAILVAYGAALLAGALQANELIVDYTDSSRYSTVDFTIDTKMTADKTFIYVRFYDTYQNSKFYSESRDLEQLKAGSPSSGSSDCSPWDGSYYPCGVVAGSVFTDDFIFKVKRAGSTTWEYLAVDESEEAIVSPSALETKNPSDLSDSNFKDDAFWILKEFPPTKCVPIDANTNWQQFTVDERTVTGAEDSGSIDEPAANKIADCSGYSTRAYTCNFTPSCSGSYVEIANPAGWGIENSHFRNWMSLAVSPIFQKLRARVSEDLDVGDVVRVEVISNWDAQTTGGSKALVIADANWQGGRGLFLPVALILIGAGYCLGTLGIWFRWKRHPRPIGDMGAFHFAKSSLFQ